MRFGLIHRVMTDALAAFGVLALVLSGQFSATVSAVILTGLAAALLSPESWQKRLAHGHVDTAILLGVLAVESLRIIDECRCA